MFTLLCHVDIQGFRFDLANPPHGCMLDPDLGILKHERLGVHRLHAWDPPLDASFHPRGVITPAGDYLVVFSAGRGHLWHSPRFEDQKSNDLVMYRSSDGGETWMGPHLPFQCPYAHNSSVPFVPRGSARIYLFSTEANPEWGGWPDGGIAMRYSDDDGWNWSEPERIEPINAPGYRGHSHMQMTETDHGTWLLGTYRTKCLTRPEGREDRQYLLRSTDQGQSWELLPGTEPEGWFIPEHGYMIEGRPLSLGGDDVLFWGRAPGGHSWEFKSHDDGKTWSGPTPVKLVHPDAPPMMWRLPDGRLFSLIHNRYDPDRPKHAHNQRTELWFAISSDNAYTWSEPRFLLANAAEAGGCLDTPMVSYCGLIASRENLHVFVDWQNRQVLHATVQLDDLDIFPRRDAMVS